MKLNKYIASMYIGLSLVSQNLLMYCHLSRKQNQSPKINLFWPLNKPEGLFYRCMNLNFNININFNETKYVHSLGLVSGKCLNVSVSCTHLFNSSGPTSTRIFLKLRSNNAMHKIRWLEKKLACKEWKSKYHRGP